MPSPNIRLTRGKVNMLLQMKDTDLERSERALGRYPPEERAAWAGEMRRLAEIVATYLALKPKQ